MAEAAKTNFLTRGEEKIEGPFTVTITGPNGSMMWQAEFPDYTGNVPDEAPILATAGDGCRKLVLNLLTGALRAFA